MQRGTGGAYGNAAITGGSISGVSGVPVVLYMGGIPFISLSSGSVAAGGAISGITALPLAYPDAYCYFPANILAAASAAGFYYCTFSTTTAGVAFLNTYTSGIATIPTSPTAVVAGQGAFTGDTGEEFGISVSVPILGANSQIRISASTTQTNNANAKTVRGRLSGSGGTILASANVASFGSAGFQAVISNSGSVSKQNAGGIAASGIAYTFGALGTVNTGVATTLVLSLQKATATDNIVLLPPVVEAIY
jgi:hypothetical protein